MGWGMVTAVEWAALCCYVVCTFVFCVWAVRRTLKERSIIHRLRHGIATNAEIIRSGRLSFGRSNAHYVTYRYKVSQDDSYIREQAVSEKYYQGLKSHVSIRYLPENPHVSRIMDDPDRDPIKATTSVAFFAAIALLFSLFLSAIIIWGA